MRWVVMAVYKAWKALERRHAKRMGGKRLWRPDFSDSIPDGEIVTETWDCKAYMSFSVIEMYVRAERKYREFTAGRRFHLCLFSRKHARHGDFVLIPASRFAELLAKEEMCDGTLEALTEFDPPKEC